MIHNLDPLTAYLLKEMGEDIQEVKIPSKTIVTKQTKIKKAAGQMASNQARENNDPVYKKMIYYRNLYHRYRAMLHKKYGPSVRHKARQ